MNAKNIPLKERIIFALDVNSMYEAEKWVDKLGYHIHFYKVGLQLFISEWFPVIDMITEKGHKVMVDLKLFDIPETVKLAVDALKGRNITFLTIHGNDPIIREAVKNKNGMKILAVTVLTSFSEEDMKEMGFTRSLEDLVFIRAKRAISLGCDGVVSSGLEAARLRNELGENFLVVTPGIRPGKNTSEEFTDDQKRIVTAKKAYENGADYVVVGRPISTSKNPLDVVKRMQDEISSVIKFFILLFFLIQFSFIKYAVSAESNLTTIAEKIKPSVVTVITYNINKKPIRFGSGFFINNQGHLITNFHVLKDGHSADVKIIDSKIFQITSVLAKNETFDLIKVQVNIPKNLINALQIEPIEPQIAEQILVVGSPMGLDQSVSVGIISAIRYPPQSSCTIYQITAPISPGSSGSPVINMNGKVVGIATAQLAQGQNLNFAVPSFYLKDLENNPPTLDKRNQDDIKIYKKENGKLVITD